MPQFKQGQKVLAQKKWFFCKLNTNDVVVLKDPRDKRIILKRIKEIRSLKYKTRINFILNYLFLILYPLRLNLRAMALSFILFPRREYFVTGDNKESTDSKVFGWVKEADIIGKVV